MRYTPDQMVLMPPKCASRFCEKYLVAEPLTQSDVPALASDKGHWINDWLRHIPLRHIPDSIKKGKTAIILSRDPYRWYESWWKHMSRQDFVWNAYWGHCGVIQQVNRYDPSQVSERHNRMSYGNELHVPSNVPPFKEALKDYIFGWSDPKNIQMASRLTGKALVWGDPHLSMQAQERVGWWSHWMHYMSSERQGVWNLNARFILPGKDIEPSLVAAGLTLNITGTPERVGAHSYLTAQIQWDDEMRSWVNAADGPTLNLIRSQSA